MADKNKMRFATALLHAGKPDGGVTPAATMVPVYQTSAFQQESAERLEGIFHNTQPGYCYTRVGNPTVSSFERRMAAIEGGVGALACASGMAATFNVICGLCEAGDELVASSCLYGGTLELFEDLERMGITVRRVDDVTPEQLAGAVTDRTRLVFAETISNPRLGVLDIPSVAAWCHGQGLPLVVDNTVASPYLCRPLELGADVVVESTSKYVNGGGNAISGVIVDSGKFRWDAERYPALAKWRKMGPFALLARLRNGLWRDTGACLAPVTAFLNCVGLETLAVRMERACENSLELATWLSGSGLVSEVGYPGLPDAPDHELAARQFGGKFGALVTFRAGSREKAFKFVNSVRYAYRASNIGDVKTLVLHPASTIFADNTPEERELAGVYDDSVRVSVGIEDVEDLIEDFRQALS
ncbi:O-acetylhomoserine aminocarboxypropyltransferase/cysteine synthase family protein [Olsenella uli]|uniref:O-acetylhomoserine aminocarboxypropyltransferase/cysteine synthase family protein n=1 Tax=Olsenella uli TaxID=133926 RepID=UPI001C9DE452|nr:PLP-dependent transferase [Olsenella uli]